MPSGLSWDCPKEWKEKRQKIAKDKRDLRYI